MIGRQFLLILRKDFLLARRRYLWTSCQILVPILLGIPLMLHCYVWKKASAFNSSQTLTIGPAETIGATVSTCADLPALYINNAREPADVEEMLKPVLPKREIFNNTEELYAELEKRARQNEKAAKSTIQHNSEPLSVVGLEFKSLTNSSLSYVVHAPASSLQDLMDLKALVTSETESVELRDTTTILGLVDLKVQYCVITSFINPIQQPIVGMKPLESFFNIRPVSVSRSGRKFERAIDFCTRAFFVISIIVLFVTYNIAYDARMKDFLLVMSVLRVPLLLASIVANYVQAFVSLLVIFIIPLSLDGETPLGVVFIALQLFALNAVVIGVFCGTLIGSVMGSIRLAMILWLVLLFFGVLSPAVNDKYWLVIINHINPVAAFKNVFESFAYFDLRGTAVAMNTLFAYNDVVSPGLSIIALAVDVIWLTGITIAVDHIEWSLIGSTIASMLRRKQLEQLKSQSERHLWHQDEEVRKEKPDIDAEDVAKVWETNGELAVYRFEIRAYPGEVSVLLGHNGAGKTTVYKMMCGIVRPTRGHIKILNKDVFLKKSFCRSKIGYCPQENLLYDRMTVMEHLWFFYLLKRPKARKSRKKWRTEAEVLIQSLDMDSFRDKLVCQLSQGEKRKLSVALAFVGGSRVVLLDEPTNGMDHAAKACLHELVNQQKDLRTIMLTTQYMEDAEAMGQQLYVMYMGRTVCSGDVHFVKSSFGTEYMLSVTPNDENFEETVKRLEEGINTMVPGSKMRAKEGDQIRIELPRLQERLFPEMFAKLEEEKQMKFVKDFRLTYGVLEETFQKMGEATEVKRCTEMEPLGSEPASEFRGCLFMWRFIFLLWKKIMLSLFHFPLILSQVLLPIFVAIYLGSILSGDLEVPSVKVKHSFASIPRGRFLLFNPKNESTVSTLVMRVMHKYPQIEVLVFRSENVKLFWPMDWPWVVGAVVIKEVASNGMGAVAKEIEYLFPRYVFHSDLLMMQIVSDVYFMSGGLKMSVGFEMRLRKEKYDRSDFVLAPFIMMLTHILITSSFTIIPAEEQNSHFKHLQIMTGLSPCLYWFATLIYDIFVAFLVCLIVLFILFFFDWSFSFSFYLLAALYCVINLPLAYLVSTLLSTTGIAFLFFVIFQSLAFIPLFLADGMLQPPGSLVAYIYPSLAFMSAIVDETGKRKMLNFTSSTYLIVLGSNGLLYLLLLILYEFHFHTSLMQFMNSKKFSESFDVPYGNDVIEERARVTRPSGFGTILVVKSLVKFRKNVCAVKNFTFGLDKGDVFGLVGMMGSGKSTTFNLISGVERPSSGKVLIHGKRPYKLPMMGFCAQYDSLFPALTCRQNIIIIAGMLGYRSVRKKADKLIGYLGLRLHAGRVIAHCSEGQKRRISVALALLTRADVIVMDEPTRGVDPIARRDIWKLIRTTQLNDRTLFFTTSSIEECEMLGTRYGVLCKGRFVSTGPMEVLKEHRSKLCVLQLELMDKKKKQKVLDTVHDVFPKSVPLPTPESTKQILKWHIPMSEGESLSVFFRKTQQLVNFVPVSNLILSEASYGDALQWLSDKFSNLQKKSSTKELVNRLLTVIT